MSKNLIRLSQVPVGAIFKRYTILYKKTYEVKSGKRNYQDNCLRLDNGKTERIQGSVLVEVIKNETKN